MQNREEDKAQPSLVSVLICKHLPSPMPQFPHVNEVIILGNW